MRTHLKMYSGGKSYKCNQCDYASSQPSNLKIHFKTRSGENTIAILLFLALAGHLREHLEKHSGQKYKNCNLRWMYQLGAESGLEGMDGIRRISGWVRYRGANKLGQTDKKELLSFFYVSGALKRGPEILKRAPEIISVFKFTPVKACS